MPARRRRLHNIVRYEHHHFQGWRVEIKRQGKLYRRYFKDRPDRAAALARAIRWRDQMLDALPPPRKFQLLKKPSASGMVGVFHSVEHTRAGTLAPRYRVDWQDDHGRIHRRSFSVLTYGALKARSLAVKLRRETLAQILRPRKGGGATGAFTQRRRPARRRRRK